MGRDAGGGHVAVGEGISIHSPRMGRDGLALAMLDFVKLFQSTLPAWGETISPPSDAI